MGSTHSGDAIKALVDAKAFGYCEVHDEYYRRGNEEAEAYAYAIATTRVKSGEIEGKREDVMLAIKHEIANAVYGGCTICAHRHRKND